MAAADPKTNNGFDAPAVVLCTLAALIFIFALSLFLQGGYLAAQARETRQKTLTPVNYPLKALEGEHQARLNEAPRWLDEQKTKAVMPITAAMEEMAAEATVPHLPAAPAAEAPQVGTPAGNEVSH